MISETSDRDVNDTAAAVAPAIAIVPADMPLPVFIVSVCPVALTIPSILTAPPVAVMLMLAAVAVRLPARRIVLPPVAASVAAEIAVTAPEYVCPAAVVVMFPSIVKALLTFRVTPDAILIFLLPDT